MPFNMLLNKLKLFCAEDEQTDLSSSGGVSNVLAKLKRKEQQIELEISTESDEVEREQLTQELRIAQLQIRKASSLLEQKSRKNARVHC